MPCCNRRACGPHIESTSGNAPRGASPIRRLARAVLLVAVALPLAVNISARTLSAADKAKSKAKAGGTAARWSVKPDPPAEMVKWPDTLSYTIPQPQQAEELLFPGTSSPFCLVGLKPYESDRGELYDLTTGKRVGAMNGAPPQAKMRALSPDGKYLAVAALNKELTNDVEVWSLETGKRLSSFTADLPKMSMTILDFAAPGEVLTYTFGQATGKFGYHLRVWDADSGKPLRQMDLDKNISGDKHYDISPGRKWLATLDRPEIVFYDLETGQVKGAITPPTRLESGKSVNVESFRFSPDGTEFACLADGSDGTVIAVHDLTTGDVKLTHELTAANKESLQQPASYKGPAIEFVAEPPGFLWFGSGFIDRESGLLTWTYRQGLLEFSHWKRFLTPAGLIVSTGGSNARKVQVLPFPAEKMKQSLAAYRGDAPAVVKPGEKVKVSVKVGEVRFGKPEDAQKSIETVLAERLADDGLEVSDEGSTALAVQWKEMAGQTLQEVKGGTPFGRGGTPTGRSVQSTAGERQIKWTSKDGKTKIYEHTVKLDPSMLIIRDPGEVTPDKARQQVFNILKRQLAGLPMPYFVPTDKSLVMLPMTTSSDMAAPLSPQEAMKKKIEAKKKKVGK
ncbi:MAG: WD40 repeat domain-containing protein [Deltaproteobacteria bacterium]